jgi:hypothetical protein
MTKTLHKKWLAGIVPLAVAAATAAGAASPAFAAPAPARPTPGEVVAVEGTPNLWVADSRGVIHFASDPRALVGQSIDWGDQTDLTVDQMATLPVGTPWLSAALVKAGSEIYLPQWSANGATPTLLRIQSPADLELLGVNADNYGQFVLDQSTWEQRYGIALNQAKFGGNFDVLPPALLTSPDMDSTSDAGTTGDDGSGADDTSAIVTPPQIVVPADVSSPSSADTASSDASSSDSDG